MTLYRTILLSALAAGLFIAPLRSSSQAQDVDSGKKYQQMVDRAIAFLATKGQKDDGSFTPNSGPAVTALVATAVLRQGRSPDDPLVAKALTFVEKFVHEDGGIYQG